MKITQKRDYVHGNLKLGDLNGGDLFYKCDCPGEVFMRIDGINVEITCVNASDGEPYWFSDDTPVIKADGVLTLE